ncbi:hypothetical protein [Anoxynatronum buryatiense]|uniref:Uncharacterized protein n=1 Tax=Anoxynatronum buryatiense TaxID=489973 RepID=A0AA46AKF4_9CLOT|nr:hypothetical protein [Anoxynatronum buryatiense]SMP69922.1 hypothetical protein SAMN06296020_11966 [Anoxynatronum buryatiense]
MKRYDRRMAGIVLVLLLLLSMKSVFLDPVRPSTKILEQYAGFARLAAPLQIGMPPLLEKLHTFRTISVKQVSEEGNTLILYPVPGENKLEEVQLTGTYEARVRGYLFFVLPVKQILIEGGLESHGNDTQS